MDESCIPKVFRTFFSRTGRDKKLKQYKVINMKNNWLVVLRLNVPVNNFSVMSGRSHRFLGN